MTIPFGNLGMRVVSAVVLAPLAVLAIWAGSLWFLAIMLAACVLLAREWAEMSARERPGPIFWAVALSLVAVAAIAHTGAMSPALVTLVFAAAAAGLFAKRVRQEGLDAAYGVLYLGWPAILLIWLRDGQSGVGLSWTIMVFVVAWSSDVAAFIVGSVLKGPKLWPRYSPNKTWSGFAGGLMAGAGAGALIAWLLPLDLPNPTWAWGLLLGFAAALATMAGDLWESALKRRFGVKDAGGLIPGHGGLLDRVDGLMFAAVVLAGARLLFILTDATA
ncbi:MAG: phosphatidate cytidylyltransferase [Brevundimonas sp.]|uniref:phosphatidate cytidylyltransferase n=1 Tax=Brevundimonas sp. TaxID=1871086 RepID=UPI0027362872|nr:phosphatidate cytidylyltransferase [Brevundimonas sp.]MDP3406548.1 phosphatidate cytidylyltransferase [Brevundimonas sp.]MDZ4109950.1 phosphatidate cytidylyltransferase [Brevundimonas sp.]